MAVHSYDVIVVGAGMAGLTAARTLGQAGVRVCVVEARDRIGGRVFTERAGNEVLELGAEFVHGRPPELWALIAEVGLSAYERDGAQIGLEDGKLQDFSGEMEDIFKPLDELEHWQGPDCSFAEYLDRASIPPEHRQALIGYVEGFNAADHHDISAASLGAQQTAEDATEGDLIFRIREGYDRLPAYLARCVEELGGRLQLNHAVQEILWREGQTEIVTEDGTFSASRAIITLPLGVLQRGSVVFSPPIDPVLTAAAQMRMGQVCRFTLLFREPFWQTLPPQPAMRELSFLYTFTELPPVWWTPHPAQGGEQLSNSITGWAGGPRATELLGLSADQLGHLACDTLARIFSLSPDAVRQQLVSCHTQNWHDDPFALGAYSYVAAGGLAASATMSQPLADTLFFAGEHTDMTGHWGTVHAAIRSGLRAAQQILASLS